MPLINAIFGVTLHRGLLKVEFTVVGNMYYNSWRSRKFRVIPEWFLHWIAFDKKKRKIHYIRPLIGRVSKKAAKAIIEKAKYE